MLTTRTETIRGKRLHYSIANCANVQIRKKKTLKIEITNKNGFLSGVMLIVFISVQMFSWIVLIFFDNQVYILSEYKVIWIQY